MPPLLLARYCSSQAEPLALKLARWRAALSTTAAHQPHQLASVDGGDAPKGGAAAPLQPRAPEELQYEQPQQQHEHRSSILLGRHQPSFAASAAVAGFGLGAASSSSPRHRPFTTTSSPSLAAAGPPPPPSRPPPRSGAGLGGGSGGGGGGGGSGLASVIAAEAGRTRVNAYTDNGFVVNQVQVRGAVLCLPETWLMWDVDLGPESDDEEQEKGKTAAKGDLKTDGNDPLDALVPPESLAVLDLVHPPPEVLVLGCGARAPPRPPPVLRAWLRERNISLELLRTADAVALFALLNDEGRPAVGAFLPPDVVLGE